MHHRPIDVEALTERALRRACAALVADVDASLEPCITPRIRDVLRTFTRVLDEHPLYRRILRRSRAMLAEDRWIRVLIEALAEPFAEVLARRTGAPCSVEQAGALLVRLTAR